MAQTNSITPIPIKTKLAANPAGTPRYAVSVHLRSGETIKIADPAATRALIALMDMQAILGGAASHFGGPSALAELMSSLHGIVFHEARSKRRPWHEMFHLINDAGHCENGLYALKANYGFADLSLEALKGFRSIESPLTGHGEVHQFSQGVFLSNGPLGSCLPQTQGLCFGDRLADRDRVTVTTISDGACMEGEAREALAAIPGLSAKDKMNPYVLIISDNNTKLSGRIDQDSFSMEPTFAALKTFGWHVITLENGHDLQKCMDVIETAIALARTNPRQPVAIHARTIKGYGTTKTEKSTSGAHGFPIKNPEELRAFIDEIYRGSSAGDSSAQEKPVPKEFYSWCEELVAQAREKQSHATRSHDETKSSVTPEKVQAEKVQVGVGRALIKMKNLGLPIVSISADLPGSTGVAPFQKEFAASSQDVGVAEANMISMAAGLSKEGYIPVVDTFAQFGVTKGALPLIMAALSEAPVIAFFSHAGFQDAADGASHQALTYFAMTASIPLTDVYCLTSSAEAEALVEQAIEKFASDRKSGQVPRSQIFFLGREDFPPRYLAPSLQQSRQQSSGASQSEYRLGHAQVVFDNTGQFSGRATIVAAGPLLHQALEAAYLLESEKIGVCVVNPSCINHPDVSTIRTCLRNTNGGLVTVEDHQLLGGMGSLLIHQLMTEDVDVLKHDGVQYPQGSILGQPFHVRSLGVPGEFGQSAYKAIDLYRKHHLDAEVIAAAVREMK